MKAKFDRDRAKIAIDTRIFSKQVIQKCFYWYTADFDVDFDFLDEHTITVGLRNKLAQDIDGLLLEGRITQDLNDYGLRETVQTETKVVRELIVAKAFANYEEDNSGFPVGDVSDPIGFSI